MNTSKVNWTIIGLIAALLVVFLVIFIGKRASSSNITNSGNVSNVITDNSSTKHSTTNLDFLTGNKVGVNAGA